MTNKLGAGTAPLTPASHVPPKDGRGIEVGRFVVYVEDGREHSARCTRVHGDGTIDLVVTRVVMPDVRFFKVPFLVKHLSTGWTWP